MKDVTALPPIDYGHLAQQAAEAHLDALNEALYQEERADENGIAAHVDWPESAGPYDGCQTCMVREVLWAAVPHLLDFVHHEHGIEAHP